MGMAIIVKECGGMTLLGKRKSFGRGSRELADAQRAKSELLQLLLTVLCLIILVQ
jgi:hypothetical protein